MTGCHPHILAEHIKKYGPYLYHAPQSILALASIHRHGLQPGSQLDDGQCRFTDFWRARPGCVYLGTVKHISNEAGAGVAPLLRVDLRKLDPALISCDEDHLLLYNVDEPVDPRYGDRKTHRTGVVQALPDCFREDAKGRTFWRKDGPLERPPTTYWNNTTFGDWAQRNAHVLDSPEAVALALVKGSIAYRSTLSSELIELNIDAMRIYASNGSLSRHDEHMAYAGALARWDVEEELRRELLGLLFAKINSRMYRPLTAHDERQIMRAAGLDAKALKFHPAHAEDSVKEMIA